MVRAERMYAWPGYAIRPDGSIPAVGDGGAFGLVHRMALGAAAFENPEFKFLGRGVEAPKEWYWFLGPEAIKVAKEMDAEEPSSKLYHAENSGFVVTRTGWESDDH